MQNNLKLQPAIDFLVSYGIVIIVVAVALVVVSAVAFQQVGTPSCASPPGFSCSFVAISSNGVLTAKISQALGTQITLNGAACASQQNYTGDNPLYGNPRVANVIASYPAPLSASGHYAPGNTMYSGASYIFYVYCYGNGGSIAKAPVGTQFSGYLWLNYTIPNYKAQVQKVAFFTAEYS